MAPFSSENAAFRSVEDSTDLDSIEIATSFFTKNRYRTGPDTPTDPEMSEPLDLATVLFLLKTAYLAGAVALAYVGWRSPETIGVSSMAAGFLVQAVASTLAGYAEVDQAWYAALSLADLTLGLFGYTLFFTGAWQMSARRKEPRLRIVHLLPVVACLLGPVTGFHTVDPVRATVFNAAGAASLLVLAVRVRLDGHREPLPVRGFLTASFAAAGLLCLILAGEFAVRRFDLVAPVMAFVLIVTLKFIITLFVVVLAMERANRKLERLAHTDTLTGLANRRFFYGAVPERTRAGDAVVIFDADRFKRLNDDWGHEFGDTALQEIATRIASVVGPSGVLARHGGEEFILFLPGTIDGEAFHVAERACRSVADAILMAGGRRVPIGISAGVAVAGAPDLPLAGLIRRADAALYEAKKAGGGRSMTHVESFAEPDAAE